MIRLCRPEPAELFIQQAQTKIDFRRERLIDAAGKKNLPGFRSGLRLAKGPGPERKTPQKRECAEQIPEIGVIVQKALKQSNIQHSEAGIKTKSNGKRTVRG